jgi:hypothetical protein
MIGQSEILDITEFKPGVFKIHCKKKIGDWSQYLIYYIKKENLINENN